jgi:hypothetical protein
MKAEMRAGDKSLSPRQLRKKVYKAMYNMNYDVAKAMAQKSFLKMGIPHPDVYRLRRLTYQNIRNARSQALPSDTMEAVDELSNRMALEESYKSAMAENLGLATGMGFIIEKIWQEVNSLIEDAAKRRYPTSVEKREKFIARRKLVLGMSRMTVLPFMQGVFNFMEKTLEKIPLYIGIKLSLFGQARKAFVKIRNAKEQGATPMDRLEAVYYANRAMEHLIRAGIIYGVTTLLAAAIGGDDDDEDKFEITGSDELLTRGRGAKGNVKPTNSIITPNGYTIPLPYLGSIGMAMAIQANMRDEMKRKANKREEQLPYVGDLLDGASAFGKSLGTFLEIGMLEPTNRAIKNFSNFAMMDMSSGDYLANTFINLAFNASIPWIGTSQQVAEGVRELQGQAVMPITFTEKSMRYLGVPSLLMENKPALDWRGRPMRPLVKNNSGIAGLIGMAKKLEIDKVDRFLEENDVMLEWKRRSDPDVTIADEYVRYAMLPEISYAYKSAVSKAWDDVLTQEIYPNRNDRYVSEENEEKGKKPIDLAVDDAKEAHNILEVYAGNFIAVMSNTSNIEASQEKMEKAERRLALLISKYYPVKEIENGKAVKAATLTADDIMTKVRRTILKEVDRSVLSRPEPKWYQKPFMD